MGDFIALCQLIKAKSTTLINSINYTISDQKHIVQDHQTNIIKNILNG